MHHYTLGMQQRQWQVSMAQGSNPRLVHTSEKRMPSTFTGQRE